MSDKTTIPSFGTAAGSEFDRFLRLGSQNPSPDRVCGELAKLLRVKIDEVALLKLEHGMLKFLFPPGLKTAGAIPLNGTAVAARTASTKSTLLSNNFARVKHVRIFEDIKPGVATDAPDRLPIQKLMSVPILNEQGLILGVVQISRKGLDAKSAGEDFTSDDLKVLEQGAAVIAKLDFMQEQRT